MKVGKKYRGSFEWCLMHYIQDRLSNERLLMIQEQFDDQPQVSITYFKPDDEKVGGVYITAKGCLKKIDEYERIVVMKDSARIPINDIIKIDGELFNSIDDAVE